MPIGVPRIIYCWGEELPAQWTDIYNFIFRRRMVFLMQYLDDELCNQICGLLINIHMEDRSKELEKKEMDRSGVFSKGDSSLRGRSGKEGQAKSTNSMSSLNPNSKGQGSEMSQSNEFYNKKARSMEDLLNADEDLSIDDVDALEQRTLQKITTEWLNWNAQFFDYADEPYLFYLAELLSKDFNKSQHQQSFNTPVVSSASSALRTKTGSNPRSEVSQLLNLLKYNANISEKTANLHQRNNLASGNQKASLQMGEIYSPFRTNVVLDTLSRKNRKAAKRGGELRAPREAYGQDSKFNNANSLYAQTSGVVSNNGYVDVKKQDLLQLLQKYNNKDFSCGGNQGQGKINTTISKLLASLAQKDFASKFDLNSEGLRTRKQQRQKNLRGSFSLEKAGSFSSFADNGFANRNSFSQTNNSLKAFNYLNSGASLNDPLSANSEFRNYYRKQTERTLIDEESKKVFVIINSFGGSVGNGITVHDALQFIKAGSLTLGLGVAASAASLALAGGTIGERYVTEGCHTMIHQPESSLSGQASDIWIDSQEIMKIRLDVAEIYSLSTYRPRHKILRDLDRDFYLTASETIQYGLADEIATNEVMHVILEETNRAWDYHDSKQQRLLETRESASSGLDTQTQN